MTATNPEQMRELANVVDRCAENDRNAVRVPLLHESAAALRAAADQLEAVQAWLDGQDSAEWETVDLEALDAILNPETASQDGNDD